MSEEQPTEIMRYVPRWIPKTLAIGSSLLLLPALYFCYNNPLYTIIPTILGVLLLIFYFAAWLGKANSQRFSKLWVASIVFNTIVLVVSKIFLAIIFLVAQWMSIVIVWGIVWVVITIILSFKALSSFDPYDSDNIKRQYTTEA